SCLPLFLSAGIRQENGRQENGRQENDRQENVGYASGTRKSRRFISRRPPGRDSYSRTCGRIDRRVGDRLWGRPRSRLDPIRRVAFARRKEKTDDGETGRGSGSSSVRTCRSEEAGQSSDP